MTEEEKAKAELRLLRLEALTKSRGLPPPVQPKQRLIELGLDDNVLLQGNRLILEYPDYSILCAEDSGTKRIFTLCLKNQK